MNAAPDAGRRGLLAVAIQTCAEPGPPERYGLIVTDAAALGTLGALRAVEEARKSGRVSVGENPSLRDKELQTFVLARLTTGRLPVVEALWVLDGWRMLRARGEGADLRGARLRGAQLRGARLQGADLTDADLSGADLEKADLSDADLTGANLSGANLFSAGLQNADLTEAEMCRADLRHVDLRGATLVRTAFRGADFWGAYLWNVNLSEAFTDGADVERADHLNVKIDR